MAVKSVGITEGEAYLVAMIQDASGVDLAEFCWEDPMANNEEHIFRCWDFQYTWWRDTSKRIIDQCGRAVGKTLSIIVRAWAFAIQHPGAEMVVTAPELVHLTPLTQRIEDRLKEVRLTNELLPKRMGRGFRHRPFQVDFVNGAKILGRIPQRTGKGVKGLHPLRLEMDEAQDFPPPGWIELIETLRHGQEDAQWRAHGVSKGVRDEFYRHSQPNSGWSVHRITGMHRPDWSAEERSDKIEAYGSRDSPHYRRNILGLHGDATNPLFVLHRLMRCVDDNLSSDYNEYTYYNQRINDEMLGDAGWEQWLDFPGSHKKYENTWAGMDIGLTNHPSEILVCGEESVRGVDGAVLRLLTRLHLERISSPRQREAIVAVMDFYNVRKFVLDRTGLGFPIYQELQDAAPVKFLNRIDAYAFDQKIVVGWDEYSEWDDPADFEIRKVAKEHGYDLLRTYVDQRKFILPMDTDLLGEWQGQTWITDTSASTTNPYGKKSYAQGAFHTLDAAAMMILGKEMSGLEGVKITKNEPEYIPLMFT